MSVNPQMPPVSEVAEQFVAGALIRLDFARDAIFDLVSESDFYFHQHSRVVRVVADLQRTHKPVTLASVGEELRNRGEITTKDGAVELVEIYESCGVGAGWEHFAEIVRNKSLARRIIRFCTEAIRDLHGTPNAHEIVDRLASELYAAAILKTTEGPVTLEAVMRELFAEIDARTTGCGGLPISTGFPGLDGVIGGWRPGLYILAARPAVGKSAIAVNFALNAILSANCLFFSQEMARTELGARVAAIRSQVPLHAITGTRPIERDGELTRLVESGEIRTKGTLWIDDRADLSVADITRTVRRFIERHSVRLVVVDYLQRMQHDKAVGDMYSRQVGETAKGLKTLSKNCKIPIICLAQLNRQNVNRSDTRPMLSDLRDSGEIEQEADCVLLLHPEPPTNGCIRNSHEQISVLVEKQRNGPTGEVRLEYVRPYTEFRSLPRDL